MTARASTAQLFKGFSPLLLYLGLVRGEERFDERENLLTSKLIIQVLGLMNRGGKFFDELLFPILIIHWSEEG